MVDRIIFWDLFLGFIFGGICFYYSEAIPNLLPPVGDPTLAVRGAPGKFEPLDVPDKATQNIPGFSLGFPFQRFKIPINSTR